MGERGNAYSNRALSDYLRNQLLPARDPRAYPLPGDTLRLRTGNSRRVTGGHWYACPDGESVQTFVYYIGKEGKERTTNLNQWRKWARNAEVIHRAEDGK